MQYGADRRKRNETERTKQYCLYVRMCVMYCDGTCDKVVVGGRNGM